MCVGVLVGGGKGAITVYISHNHHVPAAAAAGMSVPPSCRAYVERRGSKKKVTRRYNLLTSVDLQKEPWWAWCVTLGFWGLGFGGL